MGNTKRVILEAALELFSVQGYEATSIAQIADAVGVRKSSLYSHFDGKQAILDALMQEALEQYNKHSMFARAHWDDTDFSASQREMTPDAALRAVQEHLRYLLHDPQISRVRKLLTIEQFRNPALRELQTKQSYTNIMGYFTGLVRFLIRRGTLAGDDPESMAAQLCLPVSVWISLCDRAPEREAEVMELVERHVRQFFQAYAAGAQPSKGENEQ